MPNLTHVPIRYTISKDAGTEWYASCDMHQWAVKEPSPDVVAALVRSHVREHPTSHCEPPPALGLHVPRRPTAQLPQERRYTLHSDVWADGTVTYSGMCGVCPSPGWHILHAADPVDAYMEEHWVLAHGS
jgi:hypothetical protein